MAADIARQFECCAARPCIVFLLNTKYGSNKGLLESHAKINDTIKPLAEAYGCHIIDLHDFVHGPTIWPKPHHPGRAFQARSLYAALPTISRRSSRRRGPSRAAA